MIAIACVALPVSALTVGLTASVAGAAAGVSCTKLSGGISGTGTVSGCNDTANTGGSGTFKGSALATGKGTITWKGTGTTTLTTVKASKVTANKCTVKGDTEYKVTGNVSGGTGKAVKSIPKGWKLAALACVTSKGTFTLVPKTDLTIVS
jgi:hypothetical protein